MMRYPQSKPESNELLRLTLPLLSQHGSGCQPPSYTLWYEYVTGQNPALCDALRTRMALGKPLSLEETGAYYSKYIAEPGIVATDELQSQLQGTLDSLVQMARSAGSEARRYGDSLKDCGEQLEAPQGMDAVRQIIGALAVETRRMQESNARLSAELENKRCEMHELSGKLASMRSEALLDPLTGLTNRRGFQKVIDETLAARKEGLSSWSLLMVDIDHFKKVNDTHGHVFGDKVLQAVAKVLRNFSHGPELAVRLGGEEFALVLPDTPPESAMLLAENIRQTVASGSIRRADQKPVGAVTISIGVACYKVAETLEQWLERADQALYSSKQQGRDRVTLAAA
jgi:diguanylate cyclase